MSASPEPARFRLGVNYWPSASAMGWWGAFDPGQLSSDLVRMKSAGFDSVRIFLTWENFQPTATRIDSNSVKNLIATLERAANVGLVVMPTLFTGHMSGVNWIPAWALGDDASDPRFRVVAGGQVVPSMLANWYEDAAVGKAQRLLAGELARAVAGHPALWAWDMGNENSNCSLPRTRDLGRDWLARISDAIRSADSTVEITVGLHMEDLAEDRKLGPCEAAEFCDFLTMHGYPGYAAWANGATDDRLLPFLLRLTRWLGGGRDVLFSEFGVPTARLGASLGPSPAAQPALVEEAEAATYVQRALQGLRAAGSSGAMLWAYSDYENALWREPPLDVAVHERSFGAFRSDGSAKPTVAVVTAFAAQAARRSMQAALSDDSWLDIEAQHYYRSPGSELPRLYGRYCAALEQPVTAQHSSEPSP